MKTEISKRKTILLVDDHPDIQTVISVSLEHFGYKVFTAGCGQAAIDSLDEVQPDIAIIDYGLPDMDGIEVGKQIRQHRIGDQVILILFSGAHENKVQDQADSVGFAAYLIKPIRMQLLRERLEELESRKSGQP